MHRSCPFEGFGHRARTWVLLRGARIRVDGSIRNIRGLHFGGWLSSPHWAQHLGESRRITARVGHHWTLSSRSPISNARGLGGFLAAASACGHPAGGCVGSRSQRSALSSRPRWQRCGALLGSAKGPMAKNRERSSHDVYPPAGSPKSVERSAVNGASGARPLDQRFCGRGWMAGPSWR